MGRADQKVKFGLAEIGDMSGLMNLKKTCKKATKTDIN